MEGATGKKPPGIIVMVFLFSPWRSELGLSSGRERRLRTVRPVNKLCLSTVVQKTEVFPCLEQNFSCPVWNDWYFHL